MAPSGIVTLLRRTSKASICRGGTLRQSCGGGLTLADVQCNLLATCDDGFGSFSSRLGTRRFALTASLASSLRARDAHKLARPRHRRPEASALDGRSSNGPLRSREGNASSSSDFVSAFDVGVDELAGHARRLARFHKGGIGADPVELERAWAALAFQAEGHADQLSVKDACVLLRALSVGGVLAAHASTCRALVSVLQARGSGKLTGRRLVSLWSSLDRADLGLLCNESEAVLGNVHASIATFFKEELRRALPSATSECASSEAKRTSQKGGRGKHVEADGVTAGTARCSRPLRAGNHEWRRLLALLANSACTKQELRSCWEALESAALADTCSIRSLSLDGLVSALRAASMTEARTGVRPAEPLLMRLKECIVAHAQGFDGWSASHAVLALSQLGEAPGSSYDILRQSLLEKCALCPSNARSIVPTRRPSSAVSPGALAASSSGTSFEWHGLHVAERVASALARLDVHDCEVRGRFAAWLLQPLPCSRFASLAGDLASSGLSDASDPKVARHVRARSRSAEFRAAVGDEVASALLDAYGVIGD
eukprot:TRINITY_DN38620_c0_g1_i1.p1 TRINITY_DN38620_c0_g1~~TRINITY_DN38620_c0_g1_i1.p1  ORF type:complete len:566 (-),score=53.54 TRINITY_DN38620_c0_g1_i1:3-1637(-)